MKSFRATLERAGSPLMWVVVYVPFDVGKMWGTRGQLKVRGEVNGFPFRTSLFPTGDGRHFLMVNKKMQAGAGVSAGMTASFRLEPDTAPREVTVPAELGRLLARERPLRKWFNALRYSIRKEMADWVSGPKQAGTRARRAGQTAERLMETMEAEIELPPLIERAFARNPHACEGWHRMTASQRRLELLAIFYYRSPEARARRLAKTLDAAAAVAEKLAARNRVSN